MDRDAALRAVSEYAGHFGRPVNSVLADLDSLCALLDKWQRVQNLVSRETLSAVWTRHILDSLQLLPLIAVKPGPAGRIVDIGSGGGFPGLPLAIALKGTGADLHLIDSNGRKCAYLGAVKRDLDVPITVHNARIEAVSARMVGGAADLVTARALAPLTALFGYMQPFWGPRTRALLHKGREYGEEIVNADSVWRFDVLEHTSVTDADGVILEISGLHPRP